MRRVERCRLRGRSTAALDDLLDRDAIARCLQRYARGIDRLDEDLYRSAFHPDAFDCHGEMNVTIDEFVEQAFPAVAARTASQHFLLNQTIDVHGDVAHVESYLIVVKQVEEDGPVEQIGGRHIDRLERRDGEWRIALRVVVVDWYVHTEGSRPELGTSAYWQGTRDRTDVSYERPLQAHSRSPRLGM